MRIIIGIVSLSFLSMLAILIFINLVSSSYEISNLNGQKLNSQKVAQKVQQKITEKASSKSQKRFFDKIPKDSLITVIETNLNYDEQIEEVEFTIANQKFIEKANQNKLTQTEKSEFKKLLQKRDALFAKKVDQILKQNF